MQRTYKSNRIEKILISFICVWLENEKVYEWKTFLFC